MMAGMLSSIVFVVYALVSQWQQQVLLYQVHTGTSSMTTSSKILELDDEDDNVRQEGENVTAMHPVVSEQPLLLPNSTLLMALAVLKYTVLLFFVVRVLRSNSMSRLVRWCMRARRKSSPLPSSSVLATLYNWMNRSAESFTRTTTSTSSTFKWRVELMKTAVLMTWLACISTSHPLQRMKKIKNQEHLLLVQSSYLLVATRLYILSCNQQQQQTSFISRVLKKMAVGYLDFSLALTMMSSHWVGGSSTSFSDSPGVENDVAGQKGEKAGVQDVTKASPSPLVPFIKRYFEMGGWVNQISTNHHQLVPEFCSLWKVARLEKLLMLKESLDLFLPCSPSTTTSDSNLFCGGFFSHGGGSNSSNRVTASIMALVADNDKFEWCVPTCKSDQQSQLQHHQRVIKTTFDRVRWYVQAFKLLSLLTTTIHNNNNTTSSSSSLHAHALTFWRSCVVGLTDALTSHQDHVAATSTTSTNNYNNLSKKTGEVNRPSTLTPTSTDTTALTEIKWMRIVVQSLNVLLLTTHLQTSHPVVIESTSSSSLCAKKMRLRAIKVLKESLLSIPASSSSLSCVWINISSLMALYASCAAIHATSTSTPYNSSSKTSVNTINAAAHLYLAVRKSIVPLIETHLVLQTTTFTSTPPAAGVPGAYEHHREADVFIRRMADGVIRLGRQIIV